MSDSDSNTVNVQAVLHKAKLVFDTPVIEHEIEKLAQRITERLNGTNVLVLCVMQGGLMFTGKIMRYLPLDAEFDYIHATRYSEKTHGQALEWIAYPKKPLKDRTVLILDDILDEGHTLAGIRAYCKEQGAREVISAVLLQKKHERLAPEVECEYIALEVEDRYVFGYGMDYKGKLRHLDKIYAV
jgi:hypoxanthine phosphoribosyltransferase